MSTVQTIPGFDLASELFKNVVIKNVRVPSRSDGDNWYGLLRHREIALRNYLRTGSEKNHLGYENWPEQARMHIQSELEEIAHLDRAVKGYPFTLGNLTFLMDSKLQDGYKWPVFVPLDVDSPHFCLKVSGSRYDPYTEILPNNLHPDIAPHYQPAIKNLLDIRRKTGTDSAVSISFTNTVSPPDWARQAIIKAQSSKLFSKIHILIDHSDVPWEVVSGKTVIDIKEMHRLDQLAKEAEARRAEERRLRLLIDPMVIGFNSFSKHYVGFGTFTVNSWSVIALYDPSRHEQYVYDNFALKPKDF